MSPVIAVVVPMLDAARHIEVLLNSLLQQEFDHEWELIAVDNGSDDGTGDIVRALLGSALPPNLVRCEVVVASPRGYATPRNVGAERSTAPLLAYCDADGAVDQLWLQAMVSALERHPLVASRKFRTTDVAIRTADAAWSEQRELESLLGLTFAPTAGLACTRAVFDAIGGFDPYFDLGGEDVDFSLRARFLLGVVPVIEPAAIYWTKVPSLPKKFVSKGYRDGRSHVRLYQRHLGQHSEPASGASETLRRLYRVARLLVGWRHSSASRRAEIAWHVGCAGGRAVWSVRLRVRDF